MSNQKLVSRLDYIYSVQTKLVIRLKFKTMIFGLLFKPYLWFEVWTSNLDCKCMSGIWTNTCACAFHTPASKLAPIRCIYEIVATKMDLTHVFHTLHVINVCEIGRWMRSKFKTRPHGRLSRSYGVFKIRVQLPSSPINFKSNAGAPSGGSRTFCGRCLSAFTTL